MTNTTYKDGVGTDSNPVEEKPPIRDGNLTIRRIIGYQPGGMNRREANYLADKYFVDRLGYR